MVLSNTILARLKAPLLVTDKSLIVTLPDMTCADAAIAIEAASNAQSSGNKTGK